MKLQSWIAYKKTDGVKEDIGIVKTGIGATNLQAWQKAAHKFVGKPYVTIGWSLHVRKSEIVNAN